MSEPDSATYHPVCRLRDLRRGEGQAFVVDGRSVAVFRDGDRLFAVSGRCPHNGMSLHDGCVTQGVVTCRWHGWSFDLVTGTTPGGAADGPRIRIYAVRVAGDRVEVSVDAGTEG